MANNNWTLADIERKGLKVVEQAIPPNSGELKKQKYGNKKTNGFDSKHEYECFKKLELRQKTGEITALSTQVAFHLQDCKYIADFVYLDLKTKLWVIADAKGMKTAMYRLKKKMMLSILGIEIVEM